MNKGYNRLYIGVFLIFISLLTGVIGYTTIENFRLIDAFYMTVITVSTVGFSEVNGLSDGGKIFTSLFIIMNIGIFAYAISVISTFIFEGEFKNIIKNIKLGYQVSKLKDHVIICGMGRNGLKASEELKHTKHKFVIVEHSLEVAQTKPHADNYQILVGDATSDDVLIQAGIEKAKVLITTLPKDSDNVFITLTAREMNPNIRIISRASEENSERKLLKAGANNVIQPDNLGGLHMAQLVTKPYVIEFLEILNGIGTNTLNLEELNFKNIKSEFKGKSLGDLNIRRKTGATVIAYKNDKGIFEFNPKAEIVMGDEDVFILLGDENQISNFRENFCLH